MDKVPMGSITSRLAALRPAPRCSEIILSDGNVLEDCRRIRWLVTALARHHAVDLVAMRQRCGQLLNARNYLPLPLAPDLLLVPLPLAGSGEKLGYVNFHCIENKEGDRDSRFELTGDTVLECFLSRATLERRLLAARYVAMCLGNSSPFL